MKTTEDRAKALAVVASLLSLVAFVTYSWKILVGESKPNVSSWMVWSFLTILNFTSYKKLTGDWVKSILPTANAAMTLITLLCALRTGAVRSLDAYDQSCLLIGILAGLGWWVHKMPAYAQVMLQVSIVIGFVPTLKGVWHDPISEPWIPWLLWTLSFITQSCLVKLTWRGKLMDFLYPVNMVVFHALVFVLTRR